MPLRRSNRNQKGIFYGEIEQSEETDFEPKIEAED